MARSLRPLLVFLTALGTLVLGLSPRGATPGGGVGEEGPSAAREQAYRANNIGVALLEQYRFADGVEQFRRALVLDPSYAQAQINLAIGLFYVPDVSAARREAEKAAALSSDALQPPYLLGLIARQENRPEDALRSLRLVQSKDPKDVGTAVNLGQVLLQQRLYEDAIPLLEEAVRTEPYNVTATYNLGVALTRAGRREEGAVVTKRFQELRESLYKTQFGQTYLEQGRYAEAVASTGAEPELVSAQGAAPSFLDEVVVLPADRPTTRGPARPALLDADGDGLLDLLWAASDGVRLLRNAGARFEDLTAPRGLSGRKAGAAVGADLDNDGRSDLLLLQPLVLLRNGGAAFEAPAAPTGLPEESDAQAAALADLDHDGDLDVVLGGPGGQRLFRNNGDLTFAELTRESGIAGGGTTLALVATDFDNRRDLDLVVARADAPPGLFKNRRDGTFEDVAGEVGLLAGAPGDPARAPGTLSLAAGDVNKDGFTDLFLGSASSGRIALSDGRGRFEPNASALVSPSALAGAKAALFLDVDSDGLLDLVVAGEFGLRTLRNLGRSFAPAVTAGVKGPLASLVAADLDEDGDVDLVAASPDGALRVLRNRTGTAHHSVRVTLTGRVSNRTGIGAKVELRAGSLRQKLETYASTPAVAPDDLVFGLGGRETGDVVRVIWTSGIVQTETEMPASAPGSSRRASLPVTELDRKPSSCPYLFAWNGSRFDFVTDFLGGGEMGYWLAPGLRNTPDPDEYVRIGPGQLAEKDGRLELRVTNELEETIFLDQARLLAVDHSEEVEIHPAEGMTREPRAFRLFAARDLRTPRVLDDRGRDWTRSVARADRVYAEGLTLRPIRGYAEPHGLTLDLSDVPSGHTLLLLTAWTDYAFSSDNVAAAQRGWGLEAPVLEVEDASGRFVRALEVGVPVGRPQTLVLDLAAIRRAPGRRLRLATNMRVYWDRIALGAPADAPSPRRLPVAGADLSERGFSAEVTPDGRAPSRYDYAQVSWPSPWKLFPGSYTRPGDVRELLAQSDDLFVVSRPGDLVALSFDATGLPALGAGRARTFLFHASGFSKEMDINSSSPDVAGPLPFHGMESYPYAPEKASERLRRNSHLQSRYDTRVVGRTLWPLELATATGLHHKVTKGTKDTRGMTDGEDEKAFDGGRKGAALGRGSER